MSDEATRPCGPHTIGLEYRFLLGKLHASRDDELISRLSRTAPLD